MADDTDTTQQPQYSFGPGMFMLPQGYGGVSNQIQDPMMYGPQMQQMWARGLLQQASDASPVRSPWQAAARALSGVLGGYEARSAVDQMNTILGQQQAAARSSLGDVNRIMGGLGTQQGPATAQAPIQPGKAPGLEQPASADDINGLPDVKKLPAELQGPFVANATKYKLGPNAAAQWARMLMVESGGKHMISSPSGSYVTQSPAGAMGWAQVMPQTFAEMKQKYGIQGDISDPNANLEAGTAYFKQGLDAANGDLAGTAAYYNAGPTNGLAAYQAGKPLPAETQKYLASTGAAPTVTAAQNVSTDAGTGGVVVGGSNGLQTAMALRQKALAMSMSANPYERAMASQVMAQAAAVANIGAFKTVVMPNGQIANVNANTGQVQITGAARTLTKDSAENLVDNEGKVVVPHGNYSVLSSSFGPGGNQLLVQGPDGKLATVGEPGRGDVIARQDITNLGQKYISGNMTDADRLQLDTAIATQFKPTTDKSGAVRWETDPPQWIKDYYGGRGASTPGGGPAAPAQTATQIEAEKGVFDKRLETANSYLTNLQTQADATRTLQGDTQAIRDIVSQIRTGWGAEVQARARSMLAALGANDPDQISKVADAQAAEKMFLKLSFDAVRTLGSREPGSVISMTMQRFPSLESQPQAIQIMTRMLDMQQHYHEQRIAALHDWLGNQTETATAPGHRFSEFKGIGDFAGTGWDKANLPKTYSAAALAAAGMDPKVWQQGLTKDQIAQAEQLVTSMYPAEWGSH